MIETGQILNAITKEITDPFAVDPFTDNLAVIGKSGDTFALIAKYILDVLSQGVKVVIANDFDRPSNYIRFAQTLSKIGYEAECLTSPYDAQQSSADLMVVGVSHQRPGCSKQAWSNFLMDLSSSHLRTLLVIPNTSLMTELPEFQSLLLKWVSVGRMSGVQVVFQEATPLNLSRSPKIREHLEKILVGSVYSADIVDYRSLGLPENRLHSYSRCANKGKSIFKQQWLLLDRGEAIDLLYCPSPIAIGLSINTTSAFCKRDEFLEFFDDPQEAIARFRRHLFLQSIII